jgi:predicted lipoprotein with Yx(FWY)xxD motif
MRGLLAIGAAAALLGVAGCGGDDEGSGTSAGETSSAAVTPPQADTVAVGHSTGTKIKAAHSDYGRILFDGSDQAIYLFEKESGPTSECYGDCATAWPPVLTKGEPQAGSGAQASLLGTTERKDGTTQVTYAQHPLYYYEGDPRGEVFCQNVEEFGGLWLVVKPSGQPVRGG